MSSNLKISRYPTSDNRSLKSFASADDYILNYINENQLDLQNPLVYNDRFGYLTIHISESKPTAIINYKSQEEAIKRNIEDNKVEPSQICYSNPLEKADSESNIALIRVPKSMDMFRLYLIHIHNCTTKDVKVICGFMTKYFTKQMLSIASEYFETQEQSLAWKKSRLLILSAPKKEVNTNRVHIITHKNIIGNEISLKQYYGVFSAKHIDYATQFLIENIEIDSEVETVLDVASGNGILAYEISQLKPNLELHLLDDSYLANESARLNLVDEQAMYHYDFDLDPLESNYFDLVVCNPPFHFEHENTIDIALDLFHGIERVLHEDGRFLCVANLHLNYKTHLAKIFDQVDVLAMNSKFVVYQCWK